MYICIQILFLLYTHMHMCQYTHDYMFIQFEICICIYMYMYIYRHKRAPPKWQKNDLVSGGHGQAGNWHGQCTGWMGCAQVQIRGCGLDGALSWCGQGEGQSFLVSSWASRAVVAAPSFQTCFACVHMYILYAFVYICVCVYVCGHDICIYMHVCMYL